MCIASSADIETVSLWDNGGEKVTPESIREILNKFFSISLFCVFENNQINHANYMYNWTLVFPIIKSGLILN